MRSPFPRTSSREEMETINSKTFCNEIKMLLLELICCGSFFRERMATNLSFGLHLPEGLRLRVKRTPREKNGRVKSWGREACQRPQDFAKKKNFQRGFLSRHTRRTERSNSHNCGGAFASKWLALKVLMLPGNSKVCKRSAAGFSLFLRISWMNESFIADAMN